MPRRPPDTTKSLDQLEGVEWGPADYDSSLVAACHRLRTKPIGDYSVEDLRIMIGQRIGLQFLVPLALEILERDPLAEGDYYPGDLLKSVLGVDESFWVGEWEWRDRLQELLSRVVPVPKELTEAVAAFSTGGPTKR
jgi:hypothetical protein